MITDFTSFFKIIIQTLQIFLSGKYPSLTVLDLYILLFYYTNIC